MELTKSTIQNLLATNDRAVARAITVIYARQTEDEQATQSTSKSNGIGFNGRDAGFASSLAEKLGKGWTLSPKQVSCGRKMMMKYWRQLIDASNEKASA